MKKLTATFFVLAISMVSALAQSATNEQTFVGKIGDSQCGLSHPMGMGGDKQCTLTCVKGGSKFILADQVHKVVYQLDDQKTPEQYAGQMVKVTGTLDKKTRTIKVKSIEPAAENPCNPCAKKKEKGAKNPCNPCAKKKGQNPCNPCGKKRP
ncbi:MAG: hypothetical protein HY314_02885 [Acidobacteria bacterium]|nr:hypothetical protein [Acidobacteriota bacterium]